MSLITNFIFNSIYTIYNYIIPSCKFEKLDILYIQEKTIDLQKKSPKSLREIINEEKKIMSKEEREMIFKEEREKYIIKSDNLIKEYRLEKTRPNTTHDLYNYNNKMIKISKSEENILDSDKIFWICCNCNHRIPYYRDLYCSNDKVFCSSNCRDDFLINKINKINKINNNI